jgi:putative PIG3 family NAD(P)H quinone oxidoreductase
MKAIVITTAGAPEVLKLQERPTPSLCKGEVLVKVKATAVNRADLLQRQGHYPPPKDVPADIPGLEFAGIVEELGEAVAQVKKGDRVYGLAGGGTYAEYVVAHQSTLSPVPSNLSFAEAAAIPEVFITAYDAMVVQACLQAGETVLISAVGSGVGTAAVQIANAIGARPIGTARTAAKLESAKHIGLTQGILVAGESFAEDVLRATGERGCDVVLELVGGNYVAEDIKCAATLGRIIVVGLVAGRQCQADLGTILRKRLRLMGTTLRMRPLQEKIMAASLLSKNLNPLFETGRLKPVIDKQLPLSEAAKAHAYVESNDNFGKVVLVVDN